jgi:hypothetical protein
MFLYLAFIYLMFCVIDPCIILAVLNKQQINYNYSVKHKIVLYKIDVITIFLCKIFVLTCLLMAWERAETCSNYVTVQLDFNLLTGSFLSCWCNLPWVFTCWLFLVSIKHEKWFIRNGVFFQCVMKHWCNGELRLLFTIIPMFMILLLLVIWHSHFYHCRPYNCHGWCWLPRIRGLVIPQGGKNVDFLAVPIPKLYIVISRRY